MAKDVLVVDDEEWYFEPYLDQLAFEKISYDYSKDASDALKKFKENSYRLVLLDMKFPLGDDLDEDGEYSENGLQLLDLFKKINPSIPTLCYTVLDDEEIVGSIKKLEGIHISKGKNAKQLVKHVKKYLNEGTVKSSMKNNESKNDD